MKASVAGIDRREKVLDELRKHGVSSCNILAQAVWQDHPTQHETSSHPMIRSTGRILHALKRRGLVM